MVATTTTLEAIGARRPYYCYHGDRPEWLIAWTYAPNVASCLDDSNWATVLKAMADHGAENDDWAVENIGHWATPLQQCIVRPDGPCVAVALDLRSRYADYPALDEDDWSDREHDYMIDSLADAIRDYLWSRHIGLDTADYESIAAELISADYSGMYREGETGPEYRYDRPWSRRDDVSRHRALLAEALRAWRASKRGN